MAGKTITTIIGIVLLVIVGFLVFDGVDTDIATTGNDATTTEENLTGTGGPDEGFDPLEDDFIDENGNGVFDEGEEIIKDARSLEGDDDEMVPDKG